MARLFADKMLGDPGPAGGDREPRRRRGAHRRAAAVASAEPDGYTVLVATNSMVIAQLTNSAAGMSIERDLQAVASVAPQANIVVANPGVSSRNAQGRGRASRKKPLNYSSPGTGSVPQLLLAHLITTLPGAQIAARAVPGEPHRR